MKKTNKFVLIMLLTMLATWCLMEVRNYIYEIINTIENVARYDIIPRQIFKEYDYNICKYVFPCIINSMQIITYVLFITSAFSESAILAIISACVGLSKSILGFILNMILESMANNLGIYFDYPTMQYMYHFIIIFVYIFLISCLVEQKKKLTRNRFPVSLLIAFTYFLSTLATVHYDISTYAKTHRFSVSFVLDYKVHDIICPILNGLFVSCVLAFFIYSFIPKDNSKNKTLSSNCKEDVLPFLDALYCEQLISHEDYEEKIKHLQ